MASGIGTHYGPGFEVAPESRIVAPMPDPGGGFIIVDPASGGR